MATPSPTECCTRCGRPITKPDQVCWVGLLRKSGSFARFSCVPPSDNTVIEVDGLLIKTGDNYGKPVPILEDPYAN